MYFLEKPLFPTILPVVEISIPWHSDTFLLKINSFDAVRRNIFRRAIPP
jgi:hypothetical protein